MVLILLCVCLGRRGVVLRVRGQAELKQVPPKNPGSRDSDASSNALDRARGATARER